MLGRSLLHQGLVEQTSDGYAVLKLNALSWEVMRRQRSLSPLLLYKQQEPWEMRATEVEMLFQSAITPQTVG